MQVNQNQPTSCLDCATSGIDCQIRFINGAQKCTCCQTVAPAPIEPRKFWETRDQFIARAFAEMKLRNAALVEAVSVVVEPAPVVKKGRCLHYAAIRAFFACARELGFDTGKASQDRIYPEWRHERKMERLRQQAEQDAEADLQAANRRLDRLNKALEAENAALCDDLEQWESGALVARSTLAMFVQAAA